MKHAILSLPFTIATTVLVLCGFYFLLLVFYVLFSHFLPASFGTMLGMSADFAPTALRLSALGIILLALPILLITAAFFVDAWFVHKGSMIAIIIAIVFFLLPLLGLLFSPATFFVAHTLGQGFALFARLFFLALGLSMTVIMIHDRRQK